MDKRRRSTQAFVEPAYGKVDRTRRRGEVSPKLHPHASAILPLVNLRYGERWEPADQLRVGYALLRAMAGWLLVPVPIASLAGIVRWQ